jgi:DNA-directed RNA polymerase subunit RPC12/RpoP
MKCQSCSEDIPSKFQYALSTNACPYCGREIMTTKLQTVIGQLKVALDDCKDCMLDVEDWLFSNYNLKVVKQGEVVVGKDQLKSFSTQQDGQPRVHNTGTAVRRVDDNSGDVLDDEQPKTEFAKRAGIITAKKAIDIIKGKAGRTSGAADPSEFVGVDDEYGEDEVYMPEMNHRPISVANGESPLEGLFDGSGLNKTSRELEMMKLKQLQQRNEGNFRRND